MCKSAYITKTAQKLRAGPGSQGEFTGDGTVDINDLTIVLANYNTTSSAGIKSVPEPSCVVLLAIGAFALLLIRRRRRA